MTRFLVAQKKVIYNLFILKEVRFRIQMPCFDTYFLLLNFKGLTIFMAASYIDTANSTKIHTILQKTLIPMQLQISILNLAITPQIKTSHALYMYSLAGDDGVEGDPDPGDVLQHPAGHTLLQETLEVARHHVGEGQQVTGGPGQQLV